ncbi:MAG: replication protein [Circoviridae sp.]|nr:MAG: replication protein [Circoviridae sp.]
MSKNAICGFDFTYHYENEDFMDEMEKIKGWCIENTKKWSFQYEEGATTSRRHFQGRFSLKIKQRGQSIKSPFKWHLTPTSKANSNNMFYVEKDDTRVEGPWRDDDTPPPYIPRQIREIDSLYPWQEQVVQQVNNWDKRSINVVYCPNGNIGKSILIGYLRAHKLARCLPPVNDYKDMLRMICNLPTSNCYCIDMPRCMNKDRLYGFYSAIETAKDGYAYDDRYRFQEKVFDCPNIWIFSNSIPDSKMLSNDRWKIWVVDEFKVMIPYNEEDV